MVARHIDLIEDVNMTKLDDWMREFLNGRHFATLGTLNEDGSIHMIPVWYLFEDECFFVETASSTRKVRNILARGEASMMVDVRKLDPDGWVLASGAAEIIHGDLSKEINARIRRRYLTQAGLEDPRVDPVFDVADDVTIRLTPRAWSSWNLKSVDDQFFGGILKQTPEKWFLPPE
jgi:PPOX class probable F420-dependent enzyme